MAAAEAQGIVAAVREDILSATDRILHATEHALSCLASARAGSPTAASEAEASLLEILQACAFQDISGQRLSRLEQLLAGPGSAPLDPLLNGPALHGEGLSQADVDALLGLGEA